MNDNNPKLFTSVAVVGAGGIGRSLALVANEYSRRGLPYISNMRWTWFDNDEVEPENCWTQGFSTEAAQQCLDKVAALAGEFKVLKTVPKCERIESGTQLSGFDVVFIACDNLPTRKMIYQHCFHSGQYFVDMRVNGVGMFVCDSMCNREELAQSLEAGTGEQAPTSCLFKFEKERRIIHITPMIAASIGFQYYLNHSRGELNEIMDMQF
jgi:hypothetical protein